MTLTQFINLLFGKRSASSETEQSHQIHVENDKMYRLIESGGYVYKIDRIGARTPLIDKNGRPIRAGSL